LWLKGLLVENHATKKARSLLRDQILPQGKGHFKVRPRRRPTGFLRLAEELRVTVIGGSWLQQIFTITVSRVVAAALASLI
jgi:hypothetical protein